MTAWPLEKQERLVDVEISLVAFGLRVPQVLGGRWRVVRGKTTDAEQLALWQKGRELPGEACTTESPLGRTVTNAKDCSETAHGLRQYGACAVDFVAMTDAGELDWTPARYLALGKLAKGLGFEWGGDFKIMRRGKMVSMGDYGHVQVKGWRSISLRQTPEVGNV